MTDPENETRKEVDALCAAGHTRHCASGIVWGGRACGCPGDGTGSPHHTMNPPPGGWPKRKPVEVPFPAGRALRKLRRELKVSARRAADMLEISIIEYSALEAGNWVVRDGGS